ncbi:cation transporter [uncultured Neptuniibacter sp.]|uniref:cation transporter n=1 Tax=uncultured Neptuniibacter sp. TaxID=502143 RepID=UPI00260E4840|nr:cation transporter [uncultured Neptuniibacter sp.]
MAGCGCNSNVQFDGVSAEYKRILWIVIAINVVMFVVETGASIASQSMALRADALDFLGDSLTYTITLLAIGHSLRWRASAALFKGITLALMGLWVLGSTLYRTLVLEIPNEMIMGSVAMLAFTANLISALLLLKYRNGDSNVRSVWLCSRNDAIGNLAALLAAGAVFATQSPWPDLIVAFAMALLFLHSASLILRQAIAELRQE